MADASNVTPARELASASGGSPAQPGETSESARSVQVIPLRSGGTVTIRSDGLGEDLVVRSAGGAMEVRFRITDDGPVLSLRGVRLEIEAADTVAVNCREFAVNAREKLQLSSSGSVEVRSAAEIRLRSAAQTFIDGDYVNLNCLDRTGYHDHVPDAVPAGSQPGDPSPVPAEPSI